MDKTAKIPNARQQKMMKYLKQGLSKQQAAIKAGYSRSTARSAHLLLNKKTFTEIARELLQAIPIVEEHKRLITATTV